MEAMRGLSREDTLRLVEIEHYVEMGTRPDGLHITDEWVDGSMEFLARITRPKLEAWAEMADRDTQSGLVALAARKLYRAWKRGVDGPKLSELFHGLGDAIQEAEKAL